MPEVAPAPSANLVLCRWATVSGDEVFIHGAGVMMPPPQGIQWWLGGVIDINVGDARTGGRVELVDYESGESVSSELARGIQVEIEGFPDDAIAHMPVALTLPHVADIEPGLYAWRMRFGGVDHQVPFIVPESAE